ncbi:putative disease resistance protein RGA4 [Cocos nucifera]|uniref:Putative disease resistance protein RGA4 n=1 Tax=Cocos nucifera TaxID=13894 RepID=A0A8K0I1G4_COCNU|nr:putative disease resistance protein RGA4 [Cocos nucifera]
MAEAAVIAVVSPVLKLVIDKLDSRFWEEVLGSVAGVHSNIERLRSVLSTINDVLDDAERRSISDKALTGWLRKLRDAAFDADDVVDEFQYEALRRRNQRRYQLIGTVSEFVSPNNQIAFRLKMVYKIKKIHKRLDEIAEERSKFHLAGGSTPGRALDRETFSIVDESKVYGRDEDKEKIINFLVGADDCNDVSVLPIVGLGGVGKTTLAQLAYNDQGIKEHFDLKLWVCVSDDFSTLRIINKIIECETGKRCDLSNLEAAQLQLQTKLSGRRFLLVLDDVWNENQAELEGLKTLLRGGKQGSKIITTTRSSIVAGFMGTVAPHELQVLTMDHCWTLFKQRAFGPGSKETPRSVEIGKEIVEKCRGLPLAAKALGSLMRFKTEEAEWVHVRDSELWRLPRNENRILPELQLSYDHLPSDLKQCFAYCSIFPKDYEIKRKKLIQLWIAEGFIPTMVGDMRQEEVGNHYFNILLWRSFFQDTSKDEYNNIWSCKMHDLVHDLACSIARDESSIMEVVMKRSIPDGCRYSSIAYDDAMSSTNLKAAFKAKKPRSLVLLDQHYHQRIDIKEFVFYAMSSLTHLRVLDLSRADIKELPGTIASDRPEITRLRNVRDPMEAMKANLESKTNLRYLSLMWNNDSSTASPVEEAEEVFDKLQPHSNLKELSISAYPGVNFPAWMTRTVLASSPIRNLITITLGDLERCERLPALGHLPFLQSIDIRRMTAVKRIGVEFYGDGGIFPSLRYLSMEGLSDLEEWSMEATTAGESMMAFPCLETFFLTGCTKLRVAPRVPPSVGNVRIEGDRLLSAVSTGGLYKLRDLTIWNCEALLLSSWWEWMQDITAPTRLHVRGNKMMCLPESILQLRMPSCWEWMQELTALTTLAISEDKLRCLPEGILQLRMPSLQRIELCCTNFKSMSGEERDKQQQPPSFFVNVQNLEINFCTELTALPEWLGRLASLRSLQLSDCHKLMVLPDGLQCLSTLQRLSITSCPQLERRCDKDGGEDWPKIAHIPDIRIWPPKVSEEGRKKNSLRSITRSTRKLKLTNCTGRGG